ncbi:GXWXG domain-containing protein [Geodermatophilus sp. SYSU D01186]
MSADDDVRWLARHRGGTAAADALAFFDRLPAVEPDAVVGRWRGAELPTGSRLDGLLPAHGWWGKEVVDADTVHPLLFPDRAGRPRPVQPAAAPLTLLRRAPRLAAGRPARIGFAALRPLLSTRRPAARIRVVSHRGVATAAVVYDRLPVVDVLRAVGTDVLLGLMDLRGLPEPFFFVLERDAG